MTTRFLAKKNLSTWLVQFGTMMLVTVVLPLLLFAVLINTSGAEADGLRVGTIYFGISNFVFGFIVGDLPAFLGKMMPFVPRDKTEIILVSLSWTLVCFGIATILAIARMFSKPKADAK